MIDQSSLVALLLVLALLAAALLLVIAWLVRTTRDSTTTSRQLRRDQMPRVLRAAADESDADFQDGGFRYITDLRTNRRGVSCLARYYLSSDDMTMAEIAAHKLFGFRTGKLAYAMTSILDDGTILQSTHYEQIPDVFGELSDEARFILVATGSTKPSVMLRVHDEHLAQLRQEGRGTLPIRPDFIPELNEYIYQLADWELHRQGSLPEPPTDKG